MAGICYGGYKLLRGEVGYCCRVHHSEAAHGHTAAPLLVLQNPQNPVEAMMIASFCLVTAWIGKKLIEWM